MISQSAKIPVAEQRPATPVARLTLAEILAKARVEQSQSLSTTRVATALRAIAW